MTTEINADNINIDYHVDNLELFFSMFFIHWIKNIEKESYLKSSLEKENLKYQSNNKSFFSKFNIFPKKMNPNEQKDFNNIIQENNENIINKSFDKSIYFVNFPAFYYFEYKELYRIYNNFFNTKDNYDKSEIKQKTIRDIKTVIQNQKSYKSAIKNFTHFNFTEIIKFFESDESIIYFFNFLRKKKLNNYDNFGSYQNLINYLISDIILHKHYLFEECFSDFPFQNFDYNVFECLTRYMFQNNTAHLFLPYLPSNMKKLFEQKMMAKEINDF